MHGSALSLTIAGLLPKYLRHHAFHVSPFGDTVPVAPVIADNTVVDSQMGTYPCCDSFLTYAGVDKTVKITLLIFLNRPFFKAADGQHLSKHYFKVFIFYWQNFPLLIIRYRLTG
jgi:hypothetical protein